MTAGGVSSDDELPLKSETDTFQDQNEEIKRLRISWVGANCSRRAAPTSTSSRQTSSEKDAVCFSGFLSLIAPLS